MSEPLTQAERAELVAEVTRQHEQSAFARKHMDLTDNSLLRYEATVAALTAENERLTGLLARSLDYTMHDNYCPVDSGHACDCGVEQWMTDARAALPSSREMP